MILKQNPYDGTPKDNDGKYMIHVVNPSGSDKPSTIYTAYYRTEDPGRYGSMTPNMDMLLKTLVVKDP